MTPSQPLPKLAYELTQSTLDLGPLELRVEHIHDLNETIDSLFALLEKEGRPELLEKLCPYFGVIWPSARALALEVARSGRFEWEEKRVLELGCGLALPSLTACARGARVVASDFHPEVPRFLTRNRELNGAGSLEYLESDWMNELPASLQARFDWVIGSDILYERAYPEPVARAFDQAAAPGAQILLADPGRPYLQPFVDAMSTLGWRSETRIERVPDPLPKNPRHLREVFLIRFERSWLRSSPAEAEKK